MIASNRACPFHGAEIAWNARARELPRESCWLSSHKGYIRPRLSRRFHLSWLIARVMQRVFWPAVAAPPLASRVSALFNLLAISKTRNNPAHHHAPGPINDASRDVASSGHCRCRFSSRWFQWAAGVSSPSPSSKCTYHRAPRPRYSPCEGVLTYVTRIVPCATKARNWTPSSL